ncbi:MULTISPECIES: MFS transporter [unclassified Streptomyces]|uniref:MFS transporter n=1 Tax=unclassified Streptomyces TaxID=2593676 RepID=UPI002DDC4C60|nr:MULTISPECIES: MFS transporter [unclassified Streptomyces]WSA96057.1 MFS transporter [Streptomyces sp. NBC_01795]WSB80472.1 MFS transporter [Streptomyces sp. NBC_01775]WSS11321.1 MFS transporter [Streptomyces sp. NBC_01186]WSS40031.1 MFS transporter [Streptomyces sp. NBC_01187]
MTTDSAVPVPASPREADEAPGSHAPRVRRKVALATAVGNFVEWFDSGAYAIMSATIAGLFFPQYDKTAALLATWAVFAGGFIARPLGAAFFGRYGDRIGRNRMLALSVLCMSGSTLLIGLLPSYATLGIAAPVLLFCLRAVQGFSTGGEYTGASAFIMEYAPEGRRARYASVVPLTVGLASVAGALTGLVITSSLDEGALNSWGWRVPFLLAGPLGLIGLYLRSRIEDTPVFRAMEQREAVQEAPLRQAWRLCRKQVLTLFGYSITNAVGYYLMSSYMISYMSEEVGYTKSQAMLVGFVSMLAYSAACPLMAAASDRYGRRPMLLAACGGFAVTTLPVFWLIGTGLAGALVGTAVLAVLVAVIGTSNVPAMAEMFPGQLRASGSALGYTAAYVLFGGTAPFVATGLVTAAGSPLAPGFYLMGLAVVSALVVLFSFRETLRLPLTRTSVLGE